MKQIYIICLFLFLVQLSNSQTVAHFSVDKRKGCVPLTVNFVDSSYGGTVTRRDWDLAGVPSNLANTGRNFTAAGKFTIKLVVTFSNGDVRTAYDTINVYPSPLSDFTLVNLSDTAGCMAHKIQLKSLSTTSTGTITQYSWDFGAGGTTGIDPTPYFTYANAGKYSVSLIVKNNFGCESNAATKYNFVKVYPAVTAAFTIKNNFSCDTFLLSSFFNTTTGGDGLTYKWYFGDGDSATTTSKDTIKHLYKAPGNYVVKLVATNASNCNGTYTTPNDKRIFVGKPIPKMVIPDTVCTNSEVIFNGSSVPDAYSYRWIVSDHNSTLSGANPRYKFDTPGKFIVSLIAFNYVGCNDTVKKEIVVKPGPVADFSMDQTIGCSVPFPVKFTYSAPDLVYDWDFGDGTPHSTDQSPIHSYTSQGYFSVSLKITDPSTGCSNSIRKVNVIAISIPKVDFTYVPASGCKPLKVTATAKIDYLLSPLTVKRYIWNFGDNTIIDTTAASISHVYTTTGTFYIRLTILTSTGCKDSSLTKPVVVEDLCDDDGSDGGGGGGGGGFTVGKSCAEKYLVTLTDTVKNSQPVEWDFGDGTIVNTGTLNPVTHQYNPPQKIFTVTIKRKDVITNVITEDQKRVIIIDEKANFNADITDICKGMQINFVTVGIDSSKIKKYTWDYGDQTPRIVIDNALNYLQTGRYLNGNSSHVYLKNGIFPVKLIIEDKLGCKDSMLYPVPVKVQGPVAGFVATPLNGCGQNLEVTFKDTSKRNGTIPITKWIWNFGDGTPVYTTTLDTLIKHIYSSSSNYNAYQVSLKLVDSIGCESEEVRVDHIKKYYPRANMYSYDTLLCGRLNVNVYNSSYAYNATYIWDFGDGTTINSYHGSHTYTQNGLYTIKLVVKDANNCMDSITRPAYIKLIKPKADFIIGDTTKCAPVSIVFKDSSQYATSYHWFFDGADGGTDKDPSPHIYGEPGYYKVTLAITGVNGCVDTVSKTIHIKGPIAKLNVGSPNGCVPYLFHIGVSGTNIKSYAWDFGDGTPVIPSGDSAVNHLYVNSGKYLPNAILTSPEGCVVTLKSRDTVFVDELHANFVIEPHPSCDSATVQFTDQSVVAPFSSIIKSQWLFGDSSDVAGPLTGPHKYTSPGTYTVSLIVTSKYGCVDTLIKQDSIRVWESPEIQILGDSLTCLTPGSLLNLRSQILNNSDTAYVYEWSMDNVPISTDQHLIYNLREEGYHELGLTVTNSHQCSSEIKKLIFIDSIKTDFSVNALDFCGAGTVELKNLTTSATTIDTSFWDLGNGIKLNGTDTTFTYTVPGSYVIKLIATTINQCRDSSVTVKPVNVYILPKATIMGDTLQCTSGILSFNSDIITTDSIDKYYWKLDNVMADSTRDLTFHFNKGVHVVQLIVKTVHECVDTVEKNILVDSVKVAFDVLTPYLCGEKDTAKFINLSYSDSGVGGYQWHFGDGDSSIEINPVHLYANPPGSYTVTLLMKSGSGCQDSLSKVQVINQYAAPRITIQNVPEICVGQTFAFHAAINSEDTVQFMEWLMDTIQVGTSTDLTYQFNEVGAYTLQFHIETKHGCVADTALTIVVRPLPVPALAGDTTICMGTSIQLLAHDGTDYKWFPVAGLNGSTIANPIATPDSTIHYTVIVRNQFNCESRDSITIVVDKPVKIKVKEVPTICNGESILLEATGNTNQFNWTPSVGLSNPYIANPIATPTITTVYQVTGISLNTCPNDSAGITVAVGEIPLLHVVTDTAVVAGSSIQLNSTVTNVPVTYSWLPKEGLNCTDCPDPIAENIREGKSYVLVVKSQHGCLASDTIRIKIFCEDDLLVPNAFTPNGDGLNDIFYPQAPGFGIVRSMTIFNRWGEMVFNQEDFPLNDPLYGWNGTYKNNEIETSNVYVYVIRLKCANGSSYALTGKVTLIR